MASHYVPRALKEDSPNSSIFELSLLAGKRTCGRGGGEGGILVQRSTSFSHELGDAFQIFCCFSDRSIRLERPMLVLAAARFRVHLVFVVVGAGETKVVRVLELDVVSILRIVLEAGSPRAPATGTLYFLLLRPSPKSPGSTHLKRGPALR